jgi:hypothetical protein
MLNDSDTRSTSSTSNSAAAVATAADGSSKTATSTDDMQEIDSTADTIDSTTTGNDREGLVPRAMRLLFDTLTAAAARDATAKMSYTVHASYLQASQSAVKVSTISAHYICNLLSHFVA